MSITAIRGKGVNRATVVCDACLREEVVTCDYERQGRTAEWKPNEGQIITKMTAKGWAEVKGQINCPACEAKRKADLAAKKEAAVAEAKQNVTEIRQPTADQEVDIIVALSAAYDRQKKRYSGTETDRTVAEAVGGGCMPGWVAKIRGEKFGPAGNEEADALREAIRQYEAAGRIEHAKLRAMIEEVEADAKTVADMLKRRMDDLYKSEDKRVRA